MRRLLQLTLFQIKDKSEDHVYGVYLYLNGRWKLVLVDDYFPCKHNGQTILEFFFSAHFKMNYGSL